MKFIFPRLQLRFERWKWNPELNVYVSTLGNFKDKNKNNIKPKTSQGGYLVIKCNEKSYFAHRVVLMTWKPIEKPSLMTVDHLNHNKRDNSLKNLEWVTHEENQKRASDDQDKNPPPYLSLSVFEGNIIDVANWLIKTQKWDLEKTHANRIVNRILAVANQEKSYCGYRFSCNNSNGLIIVRR